MSKNAFIFPGQGSQYVGMGKELHENFSEAREVFQEVDDSLSRNLTKIIFEGPESDLNLTENTQPALMTVSMAAVRVLEKQGGLKIEKSCRFVAGHSLGEYSALAAAGALQLSDTARLLNTRGQAMQRAVPVGAGSMAAILGLDFETVQTLAAEASNDEIVQAANDNSVGQVVISGHKGAVAAAMELAAERGARRAVELPVSAPFHCKLMQPAAEEMAAALAQAEIKSPCVPVVANITAAPTSDPGEIRKLLVDQITGMVRWRESVIEMKNQGVGQMIEMGAGKVLCGLVRRIDKEIQTRNIETPEDVEAFLKG